MKRICFVVLFLSAFLSFSQNKLQSDTVSKFLQKANLLYQKQKYDSSIFLSQEAMLVASRHYYKKDFIFATLLVAKNYQAKKDYIISLEYFLKALQTSKLTTDTLLQQSLYFDIGELYSQWKIYTKSLEYYQLALSLNKNTSGEMYENILERIATHLILLHEYKDAMHFYEQLEKVQNDSKKAYTLEMIGNLLAREQEYQKALAFKKRALNFLKDNQDEVSIAKLYNNIGILHVQLQEYEQAQSYFEKSLELAKKNKNNVELLANLYIDLGFLYDKKQEYWAAISFFKQALIYQQDNSVLERANTYNYLSKLYLTLGEIPDGKKYVDSAFFLIHKLPPSKTLENTYQLYLAIYKTIHKKNQVIFYEQKIKEVRNILSLEESKNSEQKREKLKEIEKEEKQIHDLLRYQEITELEYRTLELERLSKEKALALLQKEQQLKQLSLENEIILKEQAKKDLLLAQQELDAIKKSNIIKQLEYNEQVQRLKIEKQLLLEKENEQKLQALKKQKDFDVLELKNKESELVSQRKAQNIIILLFVVALLILIIITMRIIYRQNTKELKIIQEKNKIEHQLFRSQMNPHFLFNAMNSIQSFILSEDSLSAHSYLAKFARLMRLILDNSSQEFISLEQEITTLQLYLELEKLRFENKFDFTIDVSEDLDEEFIGIPPMLIQPFIENAILHGLMTKKIDGLLTVTLEEKNKQLYCCVIDNGIGRKQAQEMQKMRPKKHKSRAIELTQKRLAIFQKQYNQPTYINVVDLYDDNENALGTKVELLIPMIEM